MILPAIEKKLKKLLEFNEMICVHKYMKINFYFTKKEIKVMRNDYYFRNSFILKINFASYCTLSLNI